MKNFKADVSNTSPLSFALTLRRKARNVSFETLYGGQFILSTQLIKKLKNYLWQVLIYPPGGGGGFWSSNSKNFTWSPHKAHWYSNNLSSPSYAVKRKSIFYTSPIMLYWQKTIPMLSPPENLINCPPPSPLPGRKISTCPWYAQTILKGALELDLLLFNQTASAFDI